MSPSPPALVLLALSQGETTGEGTSLAQQVGEAGQQVGNQTDSAVRETAATFLSESADYLTTTTFIANVITALIAVVLGIAFYRAALYLIPYALRWRRPDEREGEVLDAGTLARIKRKDTAVTLVRNTLRYITFIILALLVLSIFIDNPLPAAAGATIVAAVVGFGAQSFLRDIIAGFFILFEEQYSVGDFITVEPSKASGLVEEFGLRTTTIRALSGELIYVPNGSLIAVTNYVTGQQRFTIEVQLKDEEAAQRVLEEIQEEHSLYLSPPRLVSRDETPEGGPRLRLLAVVLPSTAWLVEENLVERIKAAAGEDGLAAEPLVYKVDERNLRRIREFIPEE